MKQRIDFRALSEALLIRAESMVAQWLPNGRREGHEWRCGNLRGDFGSSLAVNLKTGVWADFSSDEKGGDLISLYAAIFTVNDQVRAARELSESLGVQSESSVSSSSMGPSHKAKRRTLWVPVLPAPENAGLMPVAHIKRGRPECSWQYRDRSGQLLGAVYRFRTSDGGKEVLPCVWARHEESGAQEWRWMSFSEPRPLYGLDRLGDIKPVLIVEGEKCADAAHELIGSTFDVITWPGGSQAVSKADFSVLKDRKIVIWPDCDSQRIDKDDPISAFKPVDKQPGMAAALAIAKIVATYGCQVHLVSIPAPGEKPDGWDVADFIAEGASAESIIAWMRDRTVKAFAVPETISTPTGAAASEDHYWGERLLRRPRGGYEDCKENVVIALEDHPSLKGLVAKNEFSGIVEKVHRAPWDKSKDEFVAVEWSIHDDRELGMWIAMYCDLLIGSTGTVAEAVEMVAERNKYHPVKDWLVSLKWDGVDRNTYWLHELLGVADNQYSQLVGKLWLRQAVNRIMYPGSKGDYVLILEGTQGLNKSTALKRLGGEYYSDATLDLNNKDSLIALSGVWIYEIAELDAFNRAESTRIKQFITQTEDRFRPPYGKRMITLRRQTVFAATTNNYEYHKDPTGNRRFWSVLCTGINLEQIGAWREQLFAQALHEVLAGEPCYPTREQERSLIAPEQEQREIVDVWHQPITTWLKDAGQVASNEFSTWDILNGAIKMATDKMDGQRSAATRVGNCMAKLGWAKRRALKNSQRLWLYVRPEDERLSSRDSQSSEESGDSLPL
jgi:putative DNA primase/helicase